MAMSLSIARRIGKSKAKKQKVVSEYAGKASPVNKKTQNGASGRLKRGKKNGR